MGNRAVITTSTSKSIKDSNDIGVYLHWNGGRDSVEAFLEYCNRRGFRPPEQSSYGWARLCQVIGNFFGGDLSIGIDRCCNLDCENMDNGVYVIKNWQIVGREYFTGEEQCEYSMDDMLREIDVCQPVVERLFKSKSDIRRAATGQQFFCFGKQDFCNHNKDGCPDGCEFFNGEGGEYR